MPRAALALAAALLLAGCGSQVTSSGGGSGLSTATSTTAPGSSTSAGQGSVARLADVAGRYVASDTASSPKPLPAGTRMWLQIWPDRVSLAADCNTLGGDASLVDGLLVIPMRRTTEMGCDPPHGEVDAWLLDYLGRKPALERSGAGLVLRWPDGSIAFTPDPRTTTADPQMPTDPVKPTTDITSFSPGSP